MLTNPHTGTRIDEVAPGIYRINTPLHIDAIPGGFNLSQYLIVEDEEFDEFDEGDDDDFDNLDE